MLNSVLLTLLLRLPPSLLLGFDVPFVSSLLLLDHLSKRRIAIPLVRSTKNFHLREFASLSTTLSPQNAVSPIFFTGFNDQLKGQNLGFRRLGLGLGLGFPRHRLGFRGFRGIEIGFRGIKRVFCLPTVFIPFVFFEMRYDSLLVCISRPASTDKLFLVSSSLNLGFMLSRPMASQGRL